MSKKSRRLEFKLKLELARMKELCRLIEQQEKEQFFDGRFDSRYRVNRKLAKV